jgi:hypothetical protein
MLSLINFRLQKQQEQLKPLHDVLCAAGKNIRSSARPGLILFINVCRKTFVTSIFSRQFSSLVGRFVTFVAAESERKRARERERVEIATTRKFRSTFGFFFLTFWRFSFNRSRHLADEKENPRHLFSFKLFFT